MEKVYLYKGENKEFKKLAHISYSLHGLSFLGSSVDYCGLQLSEKLERKLKLFKFSVKKPRKIVFLHKIISSSTVLSYTEYDALLKKKFNDKWFNSHTKDQSYKKMPKGITKDNREAFNKSGGGQGGTYKLFCTECHFTHKQYKYSFVSNDSSAFRYNYDSTHCPNCGANDPYVYLWSSVRVPRKKASKKTWENFYKLFVEPQLKKK
jgi:hypothetical protein